MRIYPVQLLSTSGLLACWLLGTLITILMAVSVLHYFYVYDRDGSWRGASTTDLYSDLRSGGANGSAGGTTPESLSSQPPRPRAASGASPSGAGELPSADGGDRFWGDDEPSLQFWETLVHPPVGTMDRGVGIVALTGSESSATTRDGGAGAAVFSKREFTSYTGRQDTRGRVVVVRSLQVLRQIVQREDRSYLVLTLTDRDRASRWFLTEVAQTTHLRDVPVVVFQASSFAGPEPPALPVVQVWMDGRVRGHCEGVFHARALRRWYELIVQGTQRNPTS